SSGFKLSSGSLNSQSDLPHFPALPAPARQPCGLAELCNEASGHNFLQTVQDVPCAVAEYKVYK
ncbi:hypothetical protein KUCAC02_010523, partial [Chaenocephalus aceratus]